MNQSNQSQAYRLHVPQSETSLSRRGFLASMTAMAGLYFLPKSAFADSPNDVVLRAMVVSDVHYKNKRSHVDSRFERVVKFAYDYAQSQEYKKLDALLIVGDMSDNGTEIQSGRLSDTMRQILKPETKRVCCMGNHDHWGGNRQLWEKMFEQPANNRVEINGYQFISLSTEHGTMKNGDYQYAMPWLKEQLDAACADNTNKPVFLIQHYPVLNTVYGSCPPEPWGTSDLAELLKNYPRVIDFAGHSHYPTNDPRSAWQGEYTAFGTGTLFYVLMSHHKYSLSPKNHRGGMAYIMEIHADNTVVLKIVNGDSLKFYDCVYIVSDPGNVSKFIYTNKRYETSLAPYWAKDTKATVSNVTGNSVKFTIPQAKWDGCENIVHSYRVDLAQKATDSQSWTTCKTQYCWSNYFYNPMPAQIDISMSGLTNKTQYQYTITALNCFGKESQEKLTGEFTTAD